MTEPAPMRTVKPLRWRTWLLRWAQRALVVLVPLLLWLLWLLALAAMPVP